jgi:hypothetical protein
MITNVLGPAIVVWGSSLKIFPECFCPNPIEKHTLLKFFLNVSACGEPAISLQSYTVSLVQWVNPLLPVMRDLHSIPRGVLMQNQDSPVSVVLLHWWPRHDWSLWPCLRWASSRSITKPSRQQCDNPTWSHTTTEVGPLTSSPPGRGQSLGGGLWTPAYTPGDGQTSQVYSNNPVLHLYISCYVTVNKPVLSYLSLRLLPQAKEY